MTDSVRGVRFLALRAGALRSILLPLALTLPALAVWAPGAEGQAAPRRIPNGVLGGVPMSAADSTVQTIVRRLDFDNYKELVAGLAEFGDREQGTPRNAAAVDWIEAQLRSWGYQTERLAYVYQGQPREQVYATKVGSTTPGEMYILGAHMDGRGGGQAVNDNASGTALVLEIARVLSSPDIRTDRSIRFALWNNEETGLNGAGAYVAQRGPLQGVEEPRGSGRFPEPRWLGMIQHDKVMFDRGNPVQDVQVWNADVDVEYQLNSELWAESARLGAALLNANRMFATDYPAALSNSMSNTDSTPFMNVVPSVSVRENRRLYEIGRGSDPHWHQPTDVLETFDDLDYRLGYNAMQTTLGAAATLAGAAIVPLRANAAALAALDPEVTLLRARTIHERVIPMDTHTDINAGNFTTVEPNYLTGLENTQVDLPSMESGGLRAVWFSIYQGQQQDFTAEGYLRPYNTAMDKVLAIRRMTSELAPNRIGLALTAADVRRIAGEGRLVALMGMENGYALGEDVQNVRRFAELGVRYLSLAHNGNNQLADSHTSEGAEGTRWNGLSPLGREVVVEANRWGVVLDISHPSKEANLQVMELSRAPVMASHSAARGMANHSRNLDDDQLRAMRDNGGVIQVVAFPSYLLTPPPERQPAIAALQQEFGLSGNNQAIQAGLAALAADRRAEYDRRMADIDRRWPAPPPATVADLVDHIDYVVDLIGIDHVGISSDFDGGGGIEGWNDASETFNVTLELVRRGYSEEDIDKIWSGNLLRVMEGAERVANEMSREAAP